MPFFDFTRRRSMSALKRCCNSINPYLLILSYGGEDGGLLNKKMRFKNKFAIVNNICIRKTLTFVV